MSIQIEEGVRYVMADGRKTGPMRRNGFDSPENKWTDGESTWGNDGRHCRFDDCNMRIVSELVAPPEALPVRTVTRQEIVTGQYGQVSVVKPSDLDGLVAIAILKAGDEVTLDTPHWHMDAEALRAAARVFVSLAEVLEQDTK